MKTQGKYHFDIHLDPTQEFCAIKSDREEDAFHFANRKTPQTSLCEHKLCQQCLFKWIGSHASKSHSTFCPTCLFVRNDLSINANINANKNKPSLWIILTAPHSNCTEANKNDSQKHDCDFSAMRMALSMRTALKKKGFAVALFPDENNASWRPYYDENRPSGGYLQNQEDSPMRRSFKSFYAQCCKGGNEVVLALDVHSYPNEFCYASQQRLWNQKERDCVGIYDFFVLDNTPGPENDPKQRAIEENFSNLTRQFVKNAHNLGAKNLAYREGSRSDNYIQYYFRANGTPSFLLETNESLSDDQLENAAAIFAKAIASSFTDNSKLLNVGINISTGMNDIFISPVYGVIISDRKIDIGSGNTTENRELNIYVDPKDVKTVFAPTSNAPSRIWIKYGSWTRVVPEFHKRETRNFVATEKHKGRVYFQWGPKRDGIFFALEVGEGYITETVRVDIEENESVKKGAEIGEILIGSTLLVYYDNNQWELLVKPHQKVEGGRTPLFKRKEQ